MKQNNNVKVFISGPITGTTDYKERFAKAEEKLKAKGFVVINPVRVTESLPEDTDWSEYMNITMSLLKMCQAIYQLDGCATSNGALIEHIWAANQNLAFLPRNIINETNED